MRDDEKVESDILLGQMCYDELEPIIQKEDKPINNKLIGQLNILDLSTIKQNIIKTPERTNSKQTNIQNSNNPANKTLQQNLSLEQSKTISKAKQQDDTTTKNFFNQDKLNNPVLKQEKTNSQVKEQNQNDILQEKQFIHKSNLNITNQQNMFTKNQYQTKNNKENSYVTKDIQTSGTNGYIYKSLEEVLHDSMIPYTEHVVMDRALPRVEDGLKPVQRRILYAMYDMGLLPDKPYRKSATVVGECLGKYHPHGDSSVYDASVRMAQDFSLKEPLIDGHGNFGSIDGDGAAAYRYTEMKLKPLALQLLRDIEKDTVHWSLNFDDRLQEPDTLPGRFPNLLVNGAYGIAVGVATNIPPHNLGEVIDAVVAYIDKPSIDVKGLTKYIKAPDFPTGGNVIAGDELLQAYKTGKGKIIIRATVDIEQNGDKQYLVIKDVPYQVNKAQLLQKIAQLKEENKDKLSDIQEIRDESDRNGIRAVIRLKKDANAKAILDFLYKATNLQITFGINMVAIAGGKPKQMGLLEIISYYVEYQRQVIYKRTKFDLDACKDRAHILEGLLIAIQNIDEVIKIIKKSESVSIAKQKLKERFLLSDKQASAILEMKLSRLVNLEVTKIKQELAELKIKIDELTQIYMSRAKQYEVVKKEILEIKKEYKSVRKTKLLDANTLENVTPLEEEVVIKDYMLALTANKTIKAIPIKNYNLALRELGENSGLSEVHTVLLKAKSTDKVLVFTNKGNVFKTQVSNIPEAKWKERGTELYKIDKNMTPDEYGINLISLPKEQFEIENSTVTMVTKFGMIKKSTLTDYIIAKNVFAGIKLKEKDEVIYANLSDSRFSIFMLSKSGMGLNIANDIEPTGRTTSGVKAMALEDDDYLVYADGIKKNGTITVFTTMGYAKNVSVGEYELSARNRKGLKITGKDTGNVGFASYGVVPPDVALIVEGKIEIIKSKYIPYDNRVGKGKQLVKNQYKQAFAPIN